MPKATILLADNDPSALRLWTELLRRSDYEVISVSSVATAREALLHGGIDVAVLDLRLENDEDADDGSGLALAQELAQADSRTVPTIIMSGDPNPDTLLWANHERGTNRFLSVVRKDQGPAALLREIAKAILPIGLGT